MSAAALLLAAGLGVAHAEMQTGRYGVLLLGEGGADLWSRTAQNGGDGPWSSTIAQAKKALGADVPFEFAQGEADGRNMQAAIEALQSQGVRLIVAVPLFLDSQSPVMDQTRYLLGIRESPSKAFLDAPHAVPGAPPQRLDIKTPLVLARALDDSALLIDVIAARAKALSRRADGDTLVLIGTPPSSKDDAVRWAGVMGSLAQKAGRQGGFKASRAMALELDSGQEARERSEFQIGQTLRKLRTGSGIVVVPVELSAGSERLALEQLLDGAFVRYDGRSLLPDPKIVEWIKQSAEQASKLPDMRRFKKDARGLTPPPALTFENKLTISPQGGKR